MTFRQSTRSNQRLSADNGRQTNGQFKQNKLRAISEVSFIREFLITCKLRVFLSDLYEWEEDRYLVRV